MLRQYPFLEQESPEDARFYSFNDDYMLLPATSFRSRKKATVQQAYNKNRAVPGREIFPEFRKYQGYERFPADDTD